MKFGWIKQLKSRVPHWFTEVSKKFQITGKNSNNDINDLKSKYFDFGTSLVDKKCIEHTILF